MADFNGPLQIFPPGLLGFFQLKNAGRNPSELTPAVMPSLQVFDWYMQARAEQLPTASRTLAATSVGVIALNTNPMTVPNEEFWWVIDYMVTANVVTGENVAYAAAWIDSQTGAHIVGTSQVLLAGPAANSRNGLAYANGFFVPPGSTLGLYVQANEGAASIELAGNALIVRLPV